MAEHQKKQVVFPKEKQQGEGERPTLCEILMPLFLPHPGHTVDIHSSGVQCLWA